ncbi:hypothetical protein RLOatenuis_8500 [Rickettsiales bacterium]|nr:hypothetical protein RLOatenuis_8500 [Rickettsiales bacterium]
MGTVSDNKDEEGKEGFVNNSLKYIIDEDNAYYHAEYAYANKKGPFECYGILDFLRRGYYEVTKDGGQEVSLLQHPSINCLTQQSKERADIRKQTGKIIESNIELIEEPSIRENLLETAKELQINKSLEKDLKDLTLSCKLSEEARMPLAVLLCKYKAIP